MRHTPSEIALIAINTGIAKSQYRQESRDERLHRVEQRRFLKDPQPITGFSSLDEDLAEAFEQRPAAVVGDRAQGARS